jgi:uncharacterized membrane protein
VAVQPLTGAALAWTSGIPLLSSWIAASLLLYAFVGACWLPVVRIQRRRTAAARYHRLFRVWFILGWPAFAGVIAIFALMIAKPRF